MVGVWFSTTVPQPWHHCSESLFAMERRDTKMTKRLSIHVTDIINCELEMIENLLKNGADPNVIENTKNTSGLDLRTPLHAAIDSFEVEVANLLIKYGANVHIKNDFGHTPILNAVLKGQTKMIELLLTNGADKEDPELLHAAVARGDRKVVEVLLKNGAAVNMVDYTKWFGWSLLHIAVIGRQMKITKLLMNYGANVNTKNYSGCTPIHYAVLMGHTKMIELLLTNGADKEDPELLHAAVARGDLKVVEVLLKNGAAVKQHIAKVKAAGLYVSDKNLLWISNDSEINNFLNECEAEIQIMKSEKIDNSCASFYDILTENTSKLAKNESIVQALKSDSYKTKFPIYANMIDSRFRRGLEREELLEQVRKKFLQSLFESLPELPLLCTEKIISYLSDRDLRIILYA